MTIKRFITLQLSVLLAATSAWAVGAGTPAVPAAGAPEEVSCGNQALYRMLNHTARPIAPSAEFVESRLKPVLPEPASNDSPPDTGGAGSDAGRA